MSLDISAERLTVWLVGNGPEPQVYCVADRKPNTGTYSFVDMSLIERVALRALCQEAITMIDRCGDGDPSG